MLRFFIFLMAMLPASAIAVTCNSPSGFIQSYGTFNTNDAIIFGPDCNHIQSNGAAVITGFVPAGTIIANPTNAAANPIAWNVAASNNVESTGVNGFDGQQFFIWHQPTNSSTLQNMTLRVDRNAQYTGGTPGVVYSSIWAHSTVGANVGNYEWALLGQVDNSATGGQNVGVAGVGRKITSTAGPTWGSNIFIDDFSGSANPSTGSIGLEVDNFGNGTDTSNQRIVLDLVGGKHAGVGTTPTITWGWRVGAANSVVANATFVHGGFFNNATYTDLLNVAAGATSVNGIDFSAGAFSGSPFKSQNFSVSSAGLVTANSIVIPAAQTISLNGTTSLDGTFSTAAVAPVLTANKPGTSTSIGTWLKVVISGSTFWVPAWNN